MENAPLLERIESAAKVLRIPSRWLRAEAEAGRIPHLKADKTILVNLDAVAKVLSDRAKSEGSIGCLQPHQGGRQ